MPAEKRQIRYRKIILSRWGGCAALLCVCAGLRATRKGSCDFSVGKFPVRVNTTLTLMEEGDCTVMGLCLAVIMMKMMMTIVTII